MDVRIEPVEPARLDDIRTLFREYEAFLGIDLCFQGFEDELATLPGQYVAPSGALLIALIGGQAVGCVALRAISSDQCEMKRLFVRPLFRGQKLGRRLAERIIIEAVEIGYKKMRLDTFGFLAQAVQIYQDLGFKEIPAYYENPYHDVQYWELDLEEQRPIVQFVSQD